MEIDIIGVPIDLGADRRGVDMGPSAIRYAHLHQELEELGLHRRTIRAIWKCPSRRRADHRTQAQIHRLHRPDGTACRRGSGHLRAGRALPAGAWRRPQPRARLHPRRGQTQKAGPDLWSMRMPISTPPKPRPPATSTACRWRPCADWATRAWSSLWRRNGSRPGPEAGGRDRRARPRPGRKEEPARGGCDGPEHGTDRPHRHGRRRLEKAIEQSHRDVDGIYLSFDMDALDPRHAPGSGLRSRVG